MADEARPDGSLVVIGGGPGGYAAAFAAADRGMPVTLIDDGVAPGGVCLHRGCIPSKALLHTAKLIREAEAAAKHGVRFGPPEIDLDRLRGWKEEVVEKLVGGVTELCRRRGVRHVRARARFINSQSVALSPAPGEKTAVPEHLDFEHAILASGSRPQVPSALRGDDPRIMDSTAALLLPDVPRRLLVIGGGYIGLELGSVYAALGSKVTVVEWTPGLLPGADRDLVRPLQKKLEAAFEKIFLNTKVLGLEPDKDGVAVRMQGADAPQSDRFDRVLVAVGRRPNSDGVGLENTRVVLDSKGFVTVDDRQRTSDPRILAIGDVAREPMLAHKATREAHVAVAALAGEPDRYDGRAVPAVIFTDPEIAWCGVTETEAKERNLEVEIHRFPWAASGRAMTIDRTEGLTKLIFDKKTERLLGMGVVGAGAGELIAEGVLAVETAAVARDLADSIHPHPTLSETVMEAAESLFGHATHLYRPRR